MSIAPIAPIFVPFGEEKVLLRPFGDEFYSRLETLDGYTVLADFEGGITYACLSNSGEFVSTGVSIDEPPPQGLPKHLEEDSVRRYDVFVQNFGKIRKVDLTAPPSFTYAPDNGLLDGRKRSIGKVRGLTILIEFADQSTSIKRNQVDDLLNKQGYSLGGNLGSVRDYYLKMSNNKLDYRNDVIGPVRLSHPRAHYCKNLLFDDAIKAAIQQEGIKLSDYATQLAGESYPVVDAINFLYAGECCYQDWLWPHNAVYANSYDGVKTGLYMLTALGDRASAMSIGTICHEAGHLLCRFPDLYDYGCRDNDSKGSGGIGQYCLMGSGNHLASGRIPSPICGYLRKLAGWTDKVVEIEDGKQYDLRHGDYGTIHLHKTSKDGEYFILENRSRYGYDKHLPSNGLSVLHCDIYGSNEWQSGTATNHYQCALLQADGRNDLEQNRNFGDASDMFRPRNGVFFSADTRPHSREWSGADSGLVLRDLIGQGTVMTVSAGNAPVSGKPTIPTQRPIAAKPSNLGKRSVTRKPSVTQQGGVEDWPRVEIPDNDPRGVSVVLELPPGTPANSIHVSVQILHSWRGDLTVDLISPSGKTARLQTSTGDSPSSSADNLTTTWSSSSHPALARLTGTSGAGRWTLKVIDTSRGDTGTLEYVRILCK